MCVTFLLRESEEEKIEGRMKLRFELDLKLGLAKMGFYFFIKGFVPHPTRAQMLRALMT